MIAIVRHGLSALAGVATATVVVLGAASLAGDEATTLPSPPSGDPGPVRFGTKKQTRPSGLLLAWAPTGTGGLPADAQEVLERIPGVTAATIPAASLDWMTASTGVGGGQIDRPPDDMRIPVEVLSIDPRGYERFVPPSDRAAIANLGSDQMLLSETGAELRSYEPGMHVVLAGGRFKVAGVVSDTATNGYEMVITGPPLPSWEIVDRFALIQATHKKARTRVTKVLSESLAPGQVLRIRAKGETPYLRYGDAVMPQAIIKQHFGEFAARPLPDGTIAIDRRWTQRNIVTKRVPILGDVTCHRAFFPQLRDALQEVRRRGLSFLIDRSQFGGCYGPRSIGRVPGGRLSHHAWGIALDINAADNAFGTRSDLDPRLVEIMERAGLTWGGRWLVPDGMHFEWVRFP